VRDPRSKRATCEIVFVRLYRLRETTTLLQVCLRTQGTGVKSTKVLRNKGGSRRLWGYVSEHLQAFWKKKISSCVVLMRFIFSSRPPRAALARRPGRSGLTALAVSDSGRCVSMTSCLVCRRSDTCIRVGVQGTPRQTVWHSPAFTQKVEKWWMATGRDRKFGMNGGL
jgi:hypothetical protein